MVERGVKTGDLLERRASSGDRMHRSEVVRHVQWIERRQGLKCRQQRGRDDFGGDMVRTAMHDAMADSR